MGAKVGHTEQRVAFEGVGAADGDRAKWVPLDAPSCDSQYDATRYSVVSGTLCDQAHGRS